jgi:hypothetical protein
VLVLCPALRVFAQCKVPIVHDRTFSANPLVMVSQLMRAQSWVLTGRGYNPCVCYSMIVQESIVSMRRKLVAQRFVMTLTSGSQMFEVCTYVYIYHAVLSLCALYIHVG